MFKVFSLAFAALLLPHVAEAQNCDPTKFNIQNVTSLDADETTKLYAYSLLDASASGSNSSDTNAQIPIAGEMIGVNNKDAANYANHRLEKSGLSIEQDRHLTYVKSFLATQAPDMYRACLGSEDFSISTPSSATHEAAFYLTVQWTPHYPTGNGHAQLTVSAINGEVDPPTKEITQYSKANFKITRKDPKADTAISISVSNDVIGEKSEPQVTFGPIPQLIPVKLLKTYAYNDEAKTRDFFLATHHDDEPEQTLPVCIEHTSGVLLTKSAHFVNVHKTPGASTNYDAKDPNQTGLTVCGELKTNYGPGKKTTYSVRAQFLAYEVVPATP